MSKRITLLSALTLAAAIAAGCSEGSGHEFKGSAGPTGQLSQDLPQAVRQAAYDFDTTAISGAGAADLQALGASPVGTASLVAYGPGGLGSTMASLDNGISSDEQSISNSVPATSIASYGSDLVFAATGGAVGQGDVLQRTPAGAWNVVLDTNYSDMGVAVVGSEIVAFGGQPQAAGTVYRYDTTAAIFTSIASLDSATPTAAVQYGGQTFVGAMQAGENGGYARLFRLPASGAPVELTVPGAQGGNGVEQKVVAMLTVSTGAGSVTTGGGTGGTTAPTTAAVAYDNPVAGILSTNCSACHANTAIVGNSMLFQDATATQDYALVAGLVDTADAANSLLLTKATGTAHGGGAVWTTADSEYQTLLSWITDGAPATGGSTTPAPTPAPTPGFQVSGSILVMAVSSFNSDTGEALGGSIFLTDGQAWESLAAWPGADAPLALAWIDDTLYAGTASGRLLYRAANGVWTDEAQLPNNEGITALLARDNRTLLIGTGGSAGAYVIVRTPGVVQQPTTPEPQPQPQPQPTGPTFAEAAAALSTRCASCHANGAIVGTAMLFSDNTVLNDYAIVRAEVTPGEAATSQLLLKGTGTAGHGGGAAISTADSEYTVIANWINAGANQ